MKIEITHPLEQSGAVQHRGVLGTPVAQRLLSLEAEERKLKARMDRDLIRRRTVQQEITRLRCSLSQADAESYRRLRFIREGRE